MTTVVELDVPADRLGLSRTFERVPSFEFKLGAIVGDGAPLVRVSGTDRPTIETALEADPSVELLAMLTAESAPYWLCRLEFDGGFSLFERIVVENEGAILAAHGRDDTWSLQLLFHDRESVSTSHDLFDQHEFDVHVTRVTGIDDLERGRIPLTETQYETIVTAHDLGYFDVPRAVTLAELASELGVSHQALSERLRRSQAALISAELSDGFVPRIDP